MSDEEPSLSSVGEVVVEVTPSDDEASQVSPGPLEIEAPESPDRSSDSDNEADSNRGSPLSRRSSLSQPSNASSSRRSSVSDVSENEGPSKAKRIKKVYMNDSSDNEDEGSEAKAQRMKSNPLLEDSDDSNEEQPQTRRSHMTESDNDPEPESTTLTEEVGEPEASGPRRSDDDPDEGVHQSGHALDFDIMMDEKRAANRRYRKRRDIDLINDNDDAIAKMIADMRQAAREDRDLNENMIPATKKIGMLPKVMENMGKVDLQLPFLEANVLSVMTDWLAPMPLDKSLPHIKIRSAFLNYLWHVRIDDLSRLKESGIGKAVMYLYRHPKEARTNKDLAGKIINKWARPIFDVRTDLSKMTKHEREVRDLELAAKLALKKNLHGKRTGLTGDFDDPEKAIRPGDPGWVARARVPMIRNREYINRPDWQSHEDMTLIQKKEMNLLEKHKRSFADRKRLRKLQHAVKVSLEGKNMTL